MPHDGSLAVSKLRLPILHAIGDATTYRLSASASHRQVVRTATRAFFRPYPDAGSMQEALLEAWFDDLVSPSVPMPTSLMSFYHALEEARADLLTEAVDECLADLVSTDEVRMAPDGRWSLTRKSLDASVRARRLFSTQNVTAAWLDGTVDASYLAKLEAHLSARCSRSKQFNEIGELVNRFFLALIQRDGLREQLAAGNHPTPSDIRNWAYRSALSKWRDEGRDAQTRAFKGCRTEKDLRLGDGDGEADLEDTHHDVVNRSLPSDAQGVFLTPDDEGSSGALVSGSSSAFPLLDVVGGNLEDEIIHKLAGHRGFSIIEHALRREKAGASDRFARILHMMREDMGFRDIGDAEGVSRNRAASLVADLRIALQKAMTTSEVAARILRFVRDEPFATLEDMEAPESEGGLGERVDVSILDALVSSGRLRREGRGCYRITTSGTSALDNGEIFGIELGVET